MRITTGQVFEEEARGTIVFQSQGTTYLTIAGDGTSTFAGSVAGLTAASPSISAPTVTSITASSASFKGTIEVGGASDLVGFFGTTPVAVQATTATTGAFAAGTGTAAVSGSSWVGNTGSKAYTNSDVVSALKKYGLLSL